MKRSVQPVFLAFVLLTGCAGTRTSKLAKCTGPVRYANPYGTVLPSLPIPGGSAPPAIVSPLPRGPAENAPPDPTAPAKTGAVQPFYQSC
jgi:hypothetical protein